MRSQFWRFFGLLGVAGVLGACDQGARGTRGPVDVRITITCPHGGSNVTIQGWTVEQNRGGIVRWQVASGSNVESVSIAPKVPGNWPFTPLPAPSYTVTKSAPQSITVDQTAVLDTYRYNIVGVCRYADGTTRTITIDPDIVVD